MTLAKAGRNGKALAGKPLRISPQFAHHIATRGDPVPAVGRAPDQPRPIEQGLPGCEVVLFHARRIEDVEIDHPVGRNVCRYHALLPLVFAGRLPGAGLIETALYGRSRLESP